MTTTHSIELTPQQLKDVTDLLRIEAGRLGGRPGTDFIGRIYDDLYEEIQRQWTREQSRKRHEVEAHSDLYTIDHAHDMGERDLTSPFDWHGGGGNY